MKRRAIASFRTAFFAIFSCAALNAAAQVPSAPSRLDEIVVTPTLTARALSETDVSVTLIDAQTLLRQQPVDLADVLRARPGVDVASNGGFGKATSLFIRGTSAGQSVLLLDGVRMGSVTNGVPAWQFVPPQLIERIEVVRGPRAAIYGADAIGGVVQVFTRQGSAGAGPWASAGAGSFSSLDYGAGYGTATDRSALSFGINRFETDGIALRPGGDPKAYDSTSFLLRGSTTLGGGSEIGATALRSQGSTEFIGGETDFGHQSIGVSGAWPVADAWLLRMAFNEGRDESDNVFDGFGPTTFDTRRRELRLLGIVDTGRYELVLGADYRDDVVRSTTAYDERSRDNVGAFAQALFRLGELTVQPAVRWDDNEAYGREWTAGLTLGHRIGAAYRLRAGVGTAFRAPTFNDLFFPGFGNPDLRPETARSVEVAVTGRYEHWYWDLALYRTDMDDLIAFRLVDGRSAAFNVEEARIRGLEVSAGVDLADWLLSVSYSHVDPVDRGTGLRLPRRTRDNVRLEADTEIGAWSIGASSILQGHRYNDAAATERLGGFGLVNLRVGRQLSEDWSLRLTVDNLLDKSYTTARDSFNGFDFQQPGRSMFLRLFYGQR